MSEGETVTAEVKWVSPAHYVEVRAQVAQLLRERDELRHERDALYRALVRRGGKEYATTTLRNARRSFQKKHGFRIDAPPTGSGDT